MPEWDFRAADSHLASGIDAAATACTFGHAAGFPTPVFWATIDPEDPNAREEVLVRALTGAAATIVRGLGWTDAKAHAAGAIVRLGARSGAYPEPWHEIGAAGEPAFTNSWTNHATGTTEKCAFRIDPYGVVWLKGMPQNGTAQTSVFTLPVGYRPSEDMYFTSIIGTGSVCRWKLTPNGLVVPDTAASNNAPTLESCHFWAGG